MIKTSKGLNLPISGTPDPIISDTPNVTSVSLLANDFVGMKPTMMVKVGDIVKRGTKLFEDKKNPGIFFTSPAGGTVKDISRGDKRKFLSIEIEITENEEAESFHYENTSKGLTNLLIDSGLWNAFRTRPFNRTPKVDSTPDAVFVNACDTNPLSVDPFFIIDQDKDSFYKGLEALNTIFSCPIHCTYQNSNFETNIENINYHQVSGPHPAGLSSTHISQIYPVNLNRVAWTISYQDIISFGYLLKNNSLRTHKLIALGGPSVFKPSLINARISGNIDQLTAGKIDNNSRVVSGSLIYGHSSEGIMNYLGFYDSIISVIPDEANNIFLNWLMPGSRLHSNLNVFSSSMLKPDKFIFNTSLNGGDRAIVPVGTYDEILPMDILVPQLLKSLVVGDIEQAVDLGMLELAPEDLALASYICPSKYDYCSILANNLNNLYLEQ
ncbi:NADH:ubiquinone reductase (Na(+)-transporting) subunit A [Gammaproteobacteria bacterium]|nr:NADH:ubiquinone reductase (Na(+)-transporting) subunit A [Gammaproteobacteria bacterium]